MPRLRYEDLCSRFTEKGCQLLLTKDEYNEINHLGHHKLHFISSCGHESYVSFTNFTSKNVGIICKQCQIKLVAEKAKISLNFIVIFPSSISLKVRVSKL